MNQLTLEQKAERVLKMLLWMSNARVVSTLATRGFGQSDVEEGWTLLRNVARSKFDYAPLEVAEPRLVIAIDAWENDWFPVVEASLRRHYPEIAQRVFSNLSQTEGPGVVVSVATLIERLDELAKATDQRSRQATTLLARRGVTEQVLGHARALLRTVGHTSPAAPVDLIAQRAELEHAEAKLWDWYVEWSQIARSTLGRQLQRSLGFLDEPEVGNRGEAEDSVPPSDPSSSWLPPTTEMSFQH